MYCIPGCLALYVLMYMHIFLGRHAVQIDVKGCVAYLFGDAARSEAAARAAVLAAAEARAVQGCTLGGADPERRANPRDPLQNSAIKGGRNSVEMYIRHRL